MPITVRSGLGIALVAASAALLQILLTRLLGALFGPAFAFVSPGLLFAGVGVGGLAATVVPRLRARDRALRRAAHGAGLAGAAAFVALLTLVHASAIETLDGSLGRVALFFAVSALPFAFVGLVIASTARLAARQASSLFLLVLAGAAVGSVVSLLALRVGAPRGVLLAAIGFSLGALAFWSAARETSAPPQAARPSGSLVASFVLAGLVLFAGDFGAPWLKMPSLRGGAVDKIDWSAWNELGYVTVDKPAAGVAIVRTDGAQANPVVDGKTQPAERGSDMPYWILREKGPVLVLGAGGGTEIRAAMRAGQKDIVAVDANPLVVNGVVRQHLKDFSGAVYDRPDVTAVVADPRAYLRTTTTQFRSIVMPLPDSTAAYAVGALALTDGSLYTAEAMREALERLPPEGVLTIVRYEPEVDRLLATASSALRDLGEKEPGDHLFACASSRTVTLLVRRSPLQRADISSLRKNCQRLKYPELFAPDGAHGELKKLLTASAPTEPAPVDVAPVHDDRPFFAYGASLRALPSVLADFANAKKTQMALVLVVLAVLVELALLGLGAARADARGSRAFFGALGAAVVLFGCAFVERATTLLGHPGYAVSIVLVGILLSAALGALFTARVDAEQAREKVRRRAQLFAILAAALALASSPLVTTLGRAAFGVRVVVGLALVAGAGFLVGGLAPLGAKAVAEGELEAPALAQGVALAGLGAALALSLGALVALHFGFAGALLAAGALALVAARTAPR